MNRFNKVQTSVIQEVNMVANCGNSLSRTSILFHKSTETLISHFIHSNGMYTGC